MEEDIKKTIKAIRRTCKLSQTTLGLKLNLDQAAISRIENGEQNLTVDLLFRLADFYGLDACDILKGQFNIFALSKKFIDKTPFSPKYLEEQSLVAHEFLNAYQYLSTSLDKELSRKVIQKMKLEALLSISPQENIGARCLLELFHLMAKHITYDQWNLDLMAQTALNQNEKSFLYQMLKEIQDPCELVELWLKLASGHDSIFHYHSLVKEKEHLFFKMELRKEWEPLFKTYPPKLRKFLFQWRIHFIEKIPTHLLGRSCELVAQIS